jgi:hypothetical protein
MKHRMRRTVGGFAHPGEVAVDQLISDSCGMGFAFQVNEKAASHTPP